VMAWVKLDDGFYQHPKILRVGPLGMALQVAALCYANRHLTDGLIPAEAVPLLMPGAEKIAARMVQVGLWDEAVDGYQIHDFLLFQPSRTQVLKERAQKQAAGQAGGKASAQARARAVLEEESNPRPDPDPVPVIPDQDPSKNTSSSTRANAILIYEEIFGRSPANKTILDGLTAFEETRPEGCIRHCLQAAAAAEAKDWRYAKTILTRHEEEHCDGRDDHPANGGGKANGRRPHGAGEPAPSTPGAILDEFLRAGTASGS